MRRILLIGLLAFSWACGVSRVQAAVRVMVEAAHGGDDSGLRVKGQSEKSWDLRFAQSFLKAIQDAGLEGVMVRSKDESITQNKRFEILNTSGASLALVFHCDRESTGTVGGPLFVVQPPQTNTVGPEEGLPEAGTVPLGRYRQSLRLARDLAASVGASQRFSPLSDGRAVGGEGTDPKGRVLAAPHVSLRYAALPSVVVIPVFLSHGDDMKKFSEDQAIDAFCKSLAQGVAAYVKGEGR